MRTQQARDSGRVRRCISFEAMRPDETAKSPRRPEHDGRSSPGGREPLDGKRDVYFQESQTFDAYSVVGGVPNAYRINPCAWFMLVARHKLRKCALHAPPGL